MLLNSVITLGGTATAEDLRPIVQKELKLSKQVLTIHYHSYHPIISNALIQMADRGLLARPFGYGDNLDTIARRRWFYQHRPSQNPQMVWSITDKGRLWIKEAEARSMSFASIRRDPSIRVELTAWDRNETFLGAGVEINVVDEVLELTDAASDTIREMDVASVNIANIAADLPQKDVRDAKIINHPGMLVAECR